MPVHRRGSDTCSAGDRAHGEGVHTTNLCEEVRCYLDDAVTVFNAQAGFGVWPWAVGSTAGQPLRDPAVRRQQEVTRLGADFQVVVAGSIAGRALI